MILCSPRPVSIINAIMLAEIYNDLPCFKGEEQSLGLFGYTSAHDADNITTQTLVTRLAETGVQAGWLLASPGKTLTRHIAANLRYNAPDQPALIFGAVEEALRHGYNYSLNGIGSISRIFLQRYRAVYHEVHRMLGFIRFHPTPDGSLVAQPKLFHHTADLILRQFAPRYPGNRLVLLLSNEALILDNGKLLSAPPENFLSYIQNDPFNETWEKYYQSQYIASRKNSALAQRVIPKKYWSWLAEGRILNNIAQN
ncbi:MAG: hypothetical protein H6Q73_2728 [Firmicutes bacterium]|nr:hypothetical protein [Bacillota bacterium]